MRSLFLFLEMLGCSCHSFVRHLTAGYLCVTLRFLSWSGRYISKADRKASGAPPLQIDFGLRDTQPGDLYASSLAGRLHIIRALPGLFPRKYQFVGECYVHGIMDGEILQGLDVKSKSQIFVSA
jgi:hypothetical protein